jgi:hypothetical protein
MTETYDEIKERIAKDRETADTTAADFVVPAILFLGTVCDFVPDTSFEPHQYPRWYAGELSGMKLAVSYDPCRSRHSHLAVAVEAKLSSDRVNIHCFAASLGECEKEMRAEIFCAERSLESLCRKLQPTDPLLQACDDFLDRWRQIPPLVRASYGYLLVKRSMKEFPFLLAEKELADLLPRRDRVNQLFRQASSAMRMLAIALIQQADNEAEAAGIDADVRYQKPIERPSIEELADALHNRNVL